MLEQRRLDELATRLTTVPGVVGVLLGGSRARGDATPESDVDLGLYYRPPLDTRALGALARELAGPGAEVTEPGAWGPWVDGGAWLRIDGTAVDWIYRDVDRVHDACAAAARGEVTFHFQVGHPLGVPGFLYAGEAALGVVLADPSGELAAVAHRAREYPAPLRRAVVTRCVWEAGFSADIARKALPRADTAYVAGCLFRTVLLCAHALHGAAGRWLVNEKGAVSAAARLPGAPAGFDRRAHGILARLGREPAELAEAVAAAEELVAEVGAGAPG